MKPLTSGCWVCCVELALVVSVDSCLSCSCALRIHGHGLACWKSRHLTSACSKQSVNSVPFCRSGSFSRGQYHSWAVKLYPAWESLAAEPCASGTYDCERA